MNCLAPLTTHSPFVEHGLGRRGTGVGTGTGLGQAEAGEPGALDEIGQPGLLLLVGAVGQDRVDAETDSSLEGDAHRLVDATDLLDGQAQRREAAVLAGQAGAAELLGGGEPHQPEVTHLLDHVGREVVVAVPLRGVRRDLGPRELTDAATELLVLGGQLEGHASHVSARRLAIANPTAEGSDCPLTRKESPCAACVPPRPGRRHHGGARPGRRRGNCPAAGRPARPFDRLDRSHDRACRACRACRAQERHPGHRRRHGRLDHHRRAQLLPGSRWSLRPRRAALHGCHDDVRPRARTRPRLRDRLRLRLRGHRQRLVDRPEDRRQPCVAGPLVRRRRPR